MSWQNVIYACIVYAEMQHSCHEMLRISYRVRASGRGEICGAAAELDAPGTAQ